MTERARALVDAASLALTFPEGRGEALRQADAAIVRVRVALRLAQHAGWLSDGAALVLHERLDACGRMVGGWRRRLRPVTPRPPPADDPATEA